MNPEPTAGSALRHAALQLHSLRPADREWLLASLAPARRERLEVLLDELRSLGIPADVDLPPSPPVAAAADRWQQVSGDNLDRLAAALREEPAQITELLLSNREWPWRQALIARLEGDHVRCKEASAAFPAAPLARAAVLEAVTRMLPAPVASQPNIAPRWWRRA